MLLPVLRRYAFEALCTADDPEATIQVQMDAWKCIVTRTLGDLNLVYGGEVDCIRGNLNQNIFTSIVPDRLIVL